MEDSEAIGVLAMVFCGIFTALSTLLLYSTLHLFDRVVISFFLFSAKARILNASFFIVIV